MLIYTALVYYHGSDALVVESFDDKQEAINYLNQLFVEDKDNWADTATREDIVDFNNRMIVDGTYDIPYTVSYYIFETELHVKGEKDE